MHLNIRNFATAGTPTIIDIGVRRSKRAVRVSFKNELFMNYSSITDHVISCCLITWSALQ